MALIDVKKYYIKLLNQYIETKNDLEDFKQALADGYITEDKLTEVTADVERIKENVDRISYILFLFEQPKRNNKKEKFDNSNKLLLDYFKNMHADAESVELENIEILSHLRKELKKFKKDA